jgi:hypothetical protein
VRALRYYEEKGVIDRTHTAVSTLSALLDG